MRARQFVMLALLLVPGRAVAGPDSGRAWLQYGGRLLTEVEGKGGQQVVEAGVYVSAHLVIV